MLITCTCTNQAETAKYQLTACCFQDFIKINSSHLLRFLLLHLYPKDASTIPLSIHYKTNTQEPQVLWATYGNKKRSSM
ncbi:hypothetical protein DXA38_00800 [[Clostridium] innocuum]|uniref:Uncharacterized protein n=1 Tax=Clostridium innocuum TaxID=1522 RepID=A0A3E2W489_CLOIN|nr:hypothetical protein DXA38_00800 [[Clostridium] innocuum]RHV69452.1 hypothetical protein DXB22_00835 [Clostridiaceae bacterium OM02-2AC]